jgi:inorganic pyrophosphatase
MDKLTGILRMDRPQQYSNVCPSLYGFIPRTLCAERVGALCSERTGRPGIQGDGDPMDVCVLTEKEISHGDILVQAIPIGGLRMIDGKEADDKIIAVLSGDAVFGSFKDIAECPAPLVDRLRHYFLTYKQGPDRAAHAVEITHVYGRDEAHDVIRRSAQDYEAHLAAGTIGHVR